MTSPGGLGWPKITTGAQSMLPPDNSTSRSRKFVGVQRVAAAARTAGMTVTYLELSGVGHLAGALNAGLDQGFAVLYPRLGLARP